MKVNCQVRIIGSALKDPHPFPGNLLSHHWEDTLKDYTKNYPSVLGLSFLIAKTSCNHHLKAEIYVYTWIFQMRNICAFSPETSTKKTEILHIRKIQVYMFGSFFASTKHIMKLLRIPGAPLVKILGGPGTQWSDFWQTTLR